MDSSKVSKLIWLIIGAILTYLVPLAFNLGIKPFFEEKPELSFTAQSEKTGYVNLKIENQGNAATPNIDVTFWLTPTEGPAFIDITDIEFAASGVGDASCEVGLYERRYFDEPAGEIQTAVNEEIQALRVECAEIRSQEQWRGILRYSETTSTDGLLALIKRPGRSTEQRHIKFTKK